MGDLFHTYHADSCFDEIEFTCQGIAMQRKLLGICVNRRDLKRIGNMGNELYSVDQKNYVTRAPF